METSVTVIYAYIQLLYIFGLLTLDDLYKADVLGILWILHSEDENFEEAKEVIRDVIWRKTYNTIVTRKQVKKTNLKWSKRHHTEN